MLVKRTWILTAVYCLFAVSMFSVTWTTSQTLTSDYIVAANETLIIDSSQNGEPIYIRFAPTCRLIVYGSLLVQGTAADSVYFTYISENIPYWAGIYIGNSASTCTTGVQFRYAVVSDVHATGSPQGSAVSIVNPDGNALPIQFLYSRISDNYGIDCGGVYAEEAENLTISGSKLYNNNPVGTGVVAQGGGAAYFYQCDGVQIDNSTIYCNQAARHHRLEDDAPGGGGLCLNNCKDLLITKCAIHDNLAKGTFIIEGVETYDGLGGGIFVQDADSTNLDITDNEIYNNESWGEHDTFDYIGLAAGGGVALRLCNDSDVLLDGNAIHDNIAVLDSGGGIAAYRMSNCNASFSNNDIYDNNCQWEFGDGGGMFIFDVAGLPLSIEQNNIHGNSCGYNGGGIRIMTEEEIGRGACLCDVKDNNIYSNTGAYCGGVYIDAWYSDNLFCNNQIHHNATTTTCGYVGGLYFHGSGTTAIHIEDCSFYANSCSLSVLVSNAAAIYMGHGNANPPRSSITNCTIVDHLDVPLLCYDMDLDIVNSIFWNPRVTALPQIDHWEMKLSHTTNMNCIDYSVIRNGEEGIFCSATHVDYDESNIESNTGLLEVNYTDYTLYYPEWTSQKRSLCIDAGDPGLFDADETPSDMGANPAVNHRYDTWTLPSASQSNGWKWMCFPALDGVCQTPDYDMAAVMLDDILGTAPFLLDHIEWKVYPNPGETELYYDLQNDVWINDDHVFTSPQGYKVQMSSTTPVELPISGFIESAGQPIYLHANYDNWVGYFLPDSKLATGLLDSIESDYITVQAQKWALIREYGAWLGDVKETLNYGDMVVINLWDDVPNFRWGNEVPSSEAYAAPQVETFTYEERADYIPVFIEYTPANEGEEIGMYVDGVCKGAKVCGDSLTQINAYVIAEDGSVETGEVEFVITDGSRSFDSYSTYGLLEHRQLVQPEGHIDLSDGKSYYHISFNDGDADETPSWPMALGAYPNPFNPETTIRYSVPQTGEVNITVYNVRGQKVATLQNGQQSAGEHELTWNASDQPSGVYLLRLQAAGQSKTSKVLLLK